MGAADPGSAPVTLDPENPTLQFENNPVNDLLAAYERLTGMTLIKDTSIFDGSPISLVTQKPVPKAEAIRLIEATLLINGYAIVLDTGGKSARILPTRVAGAAQLQFSQGVKFYTDPKSLPEGETLVTYFMKLNHLSPEEAGGILANHVGLNVYGRITPTTTPPGLLITETATIVRQLIDIQQAVDMMETTTNLVTKFVKLKYADAAIVAQIVQSTLDAQAKEKETKGLNTIRGTAGPERGSKSSAPAPAPVASSSSSNSSSNRGGPPMELPLPLSQVVADPRLNQVLIVATPEDYTYIMSLITEFDQAVEVEEPYERKLNYIAAVDVMSSLADLLKDPTSTTASQLPGGGTLNLGQQQPVASSSSQLLAGRRTTNTRGAKVTTSTAASGGTDSTTGGSSGGGGTRPDQLIPPEEDNSPISILVNKTRVVADPQSNSIIVMGSKEAQDRVGMLLDKLDRKPAQVYLATVIGKLDLGEDSQLGVDWLSKFNRTGGNSGFSTSLNNARPDIITGKNITDMRDNLLTTPFGPAAGFNVYGQITQTLDAYVNALESSDKFKVISRPSIFALNNKKATITSGQSIPVPQGSTQNLNNGGATISTTVVYKDVVLKLEVVPLINPNGEVTLTIAQINDTITGTKRIDTNDVEIISTEQVITTVTVPDGRTVVLGGLISDSEKKGTQGLPGISRIPLLGSLFKNDTKAKKRNELLIFIQPHVVNDDAGLQKWSDNEDMRASVGEEAAKKFPSEATEKPAAGLPPKKRNWLQRVFVRDLSANDNPETTPEQAPEPATTKPKIVNPLKR